MFVGVLRVSVGLWLAVFVSVSLMFSGRGGEVVGGPAGPAWRSSGCWWLLEGRACVAAAGPWCAFLTVAGCRWRAVRGEYACVGLSRSAAAGRVGVGRWFSGVSHVVLV